MRNWMLLLLGVTACGKASAVPSDVKETKEVAVTDDQRRRLEDSVLAWVGDCFTSWERGDSAALMDTYLLKGPIVSAAYGNIVTTRDSVAHFLDGLSKVTGRKATYQKPFIDVLAPGVAVVSVPFLLEGTEPGQTKSFHDRGVWTGVVAQRDGHLRIIQEHQSIASQPKK